MEAFRIQRFCRPVIPVGLMLATGGTSSTWAQQDARFYRGHMWEGWCGWLFGPMMVILFIVLLMVAVIFIARWLGQREFEERRKLLE